MNHRFRGDALETDRTYRSKVRWVTEFAIYCHQTKHIQHSNVPVTPRSSRLFSYWSSPVLEQQQTRPWTKKLIKNEVSSRGRRTRREKKPRMYAREILPMMISGRQYANSFIGTGDVVMNFCKPQTLRSLWKKGKMSGLHRNHSWFCGDIDVDAVVEANIKTMPGDTWHSRNAAERIYYLKRLIIKNRDHSNRKTREQPYVQVLLFHKVNEAIPFNQKGNVIVTHVAVLWIWSAVKLHIHA